ncbi:MAG: ABC transporter permease [Planctomycetales bacterium]|nr:ABC transporter permease [Planctomycetales bacterium]
MRPYIAVLIDSFWEAVSNRVLWALLIGWALVLGALVPFGYVSERSFQLVSSDIQERGPLLEKLARGLKGQGRASIQRVAERLETEFADRIRDYKADDVSGPRIRHSEIADALNYSLKSNSLYDADTFPTAAARPRLKPLLDLPAESRSEADNEELNRELIQLAFPLELSSPKGERLWIGYAGFKIGEPLIVSRRQIDEFVEPLVLFFIIKAGLGILVVFIAIVVTSPMIPDTFRTGSLHLLLSKPISRVLLFLAKFLGGCIFVLVNIAFVLIGLYFIAGVRFDIWNEGLLACIPLLLFVFVIFYSVSALVGLLWGNAIVSVVACLLLWLLCIAVGLLHGVMRQQLEIMPQLTRIQQFEDHIVSVSERGELQVWNDQYSVWQPGIERDGGNRMRTFGPFYDADSRSLVVKSFTRGPIGNFMSRSRKLDIIRLVADEQENTDTPEQVSSNEETSREVDAAGSPTVKSSKAIGESSVGSVSEAREKARWMSDPGPELPTQVFDVLEVGNEILAITRGGLFQLDRGRLKAIPESAKFLGLDLKNLWGLGTGFLKVSSEDYVLNENAYSAAVDGQSALVVYSSGKLDWLSLEEGKLVVLHTTELEADGTEAAILQANQEYVVVVRDHKPMLILSPDFQTTLHSIELPVEIRNLSWVPGTSQQLIAVTHSGELWELDCAQASFTKIEWPYSGQATVLNWSTDQKAWIGIEPNRAILFDFKSRKIEKELMPAASTFDMVYNWVVRPVYTINPKPAALDDSMAYLLSGDRTQNLGLVNTDLEAAQVEIDLWTPIVSNVIFVVIVLGIGCLYVQRKEF